MWAITDFRAENGATPSSPKPPLAADRQPTPDEILAADAAGSVLFWLGGTLHGAGANVSDEWRYGVILTYPQPGCVRRKPVPDVLDIAASLSPGLQVMIGYKMNGALAFTIRESEPSRSRQPRTSPKPNLCP